MSPSYAEVEDRLAGSYRAFVGDVPEHPPVPWSATAVTPVGPSRHLHRLVGIAASIVLIVLATTLWASPSAGARYHPAEVLRVVPPSSSHVHGRPLCLCATDL
jgi:hypothetical protein